MHNELVHDFNYLMKVIALSEERLRVSEERIRYGMPLFTKIDYIDRDTVISRDSWKASLLSCGSVINGVDMIMKNQAKNAFCATRPPGHHAGVFGSTL